MTDLKDIINNNRLVFALRRNGFEYAEDLRGISREDFSKIKGIGGKVLDELMSIIEAQGINDGKYDESESLFSIDEIAFMIDAVNNKRTNTFRTNNIKSNCLNKLIRMKSN